MPVYEAPPDYNDDDNGGDGGGGDGNSGGRPSSAPRQSYNFAPGYHGIVYRADVPDWGAGPRGRGRHKGKGVADNEGGDGDDGNAGREEEEEENDTADEAQAQTQNQVRYKLQSMKWGLVPFWTKRNPDYGSVMKTINCRDDSLAQGGGMWTTMKARKRCVVVAQGFYEWLKKGPGPGGREKIPHFVKRKDGRLMCFAGLWDVVQYEGDDQKHYTYTIITTSSNKQLSFLHDRMPVILDNGSEGLRTWLDPSRHEWSKELQSLLKPFDGELEVYPVSKDVGKVGNNSPTFIIPVSSKENKSNIANFFAKSAVAQKKKTEKEEGLIKEERQPEIVVKKEEGLVAGDSSAGIDGTKVEDGDTIKEEDKEEVNSKVHAGVKREAEDEPHELPTKKKISTTISSSPQKKASTRPKISATSNVATNAKKGVGGKAKEQGAANQKITKFFANSS
ncbi:DUF159-domain-containing protein [Biscogniauxia marginata]|nr:DUF159-domain-containing protein [Biscogniauxia marginata]